MSESHAHLPATKVIEGCNRTLADIVRTRLDILGDVVERHRARRLGWIPLPSRSRKAARNRILPEETAMVELHRQDDEKRVLALLDLARAAAATGKDMRVHVSLSDFQLINRHWR